MARKHKHEEHANHEAWAIPYGDLITLLLAFFVVMYAVSSVNEGKYRVLADSLSSAFGGPPRTLKPVQVGNKPEKGTQNESLFSTVTLRGFEQERSGIEPDMPGARMGGDQKAPGGTAQKPGERSAASQGAENLQRMANAVQQAMQGLIDQKLVEFHSRAQFFALAATLMRHILVDHARTRHALKHGGAGVRISFEEALLVSAHRDEDLVELDQALTRLAEIDERKSKVVELRFFGGLTVDETAEALGVSAVTVMREWKMAKAWLFNVLNSET